MDPISLPPPPEPSAAPPASARPAQPARPATPDMGDLASAIVDDGDLIEKEWVTRAKHIVSTTRNDPYKQSEQMTALRAEYMKKRYGKDVKLDK